MYPPINQVFLGNDPLNGMDDIDLQIQKMEAYRNKLQQLKSHQQVQQRFIWDDIDAEVSPLTEEQKAALFKNEDYLTNYNRIQGMVQAELINLVKGKIEGTPEGKELLSNQLKMVKKLKAQVIQETNKEMELFKKFKEFSKKHPEVTYEEFIKANM